MLANEHPSTCVRELRTAQSDSHAVASRVPSGRAAPTRFELRTVLTSVACHPATGWLKMGTHAVAVATSTPPRENLGVAVTVRAPARDDRRPGAGRRSGAEPRGFFREQPPCIRRSSASARRVGSGARTARPEETPRRRRVTPPPWQVPPAPATRGEHRNRRGEVRTRTIPRLSAHARNGSTTRPTSANAAASRATTKPNRTTCCASTCACAAAPAKPKRAGARAPRSRLRPSSWGRARILYMRL
jgi:hypothetical protein